MNDQDIIAALNARTPGFLRMLGGSIISIDRSQRSCTFEFNVSTDFCHSVNVVQGGFVTTMLDAAMSHALLLENPVERMGISSLEIKTTYLEPTLAGQLRAVGKVLKSTYKTGFFEGHLYNADGLLTATTSSVAKLVRGK